jgi:MATE family multidrug resistance protein
MNGKENSAQKGSYLEVWRVALPLIISTGSFTVLHFCDRMFLSWHSSEAFRAALPAGILSFTLMCGFVALAAYANTFVAQFHGARDFHGCARATVQGAILALLAWPCMLALILPGIYILKISGHGPEVFRLERIYFTILMVGSVSQPFAAAVAGFFSGRGKTVVVMACNVVGNAVNIALNYALIFGHWGLPELGIVGAGLATVLASWVAPLLMVALFFAPRNHRRFGTRRSLHFDGPLLRRMVRFGGPSGLHLFLDIASFTVFVMLVGRLGAVQHIASNVALSINLIAFMPMIGLGLAASILTGRYQGARDSFTAGRTGWRTLHLGLVYTLVIAVTFLTSPRFYFMLFAGHSGAGINSPEVFQATRVLLMILAAWGMLDAVNLIIAGALKGAGDTRFVMGYQTALAWGVFVPGELLLVLVFGRGIFAAWSWCAVYIALLSVGLLLRFHSGRWKSIDLLGAQRQTGRTLKELEARSGPC